jgi:hypothetical protein
MKTLLLGVSLATMAVVPMRAARAQADSTERQLPERGAVMGAVESAGPSVVNALRIIDVADDGTYITLQDGTTWEVYLPDRTSTAGWRKGDAVVVSFRPIVVGQNYGYELTNGRVDSGAAVKFRGLVESSQ